MMLDTIETYEDNPTELTVTSNTAQELIQFMTDWGDISGRCDVAALDRMLSDDLVQTMLDGTVLTKAEYPEEDIPEDFCITDYDRQVQILDRTAIVRAAYALEIGGKGMHWRYTATVIKRDGKWDVVALHSSPLPKL